LRNLSHFRTQNTAHLVCKQTLCHTAMSNSSDTGTRNMGAQMLESLRL